MFKRFADWLSLKEKIDAQKISPPFFSEGEIWWCYMGENIGVKINGKGNDFIRPILILKKYNQYSFFGLPLTTRKRAGSSYTKLMFKNKEQWVVHIQGKALDFKRLKFLMGEIRNFELSKVRKDYLRNC